MTDTAVATARPQPPDKHSRPQFRRRRMWIPVAAALALILFTVVAAWVESPSPGSDDFLSPRGTGGDGSSRLAERLDDEGVSVSRYTEVGDAFFDAVSSGNATVFIPAPDYLNTRELSDLYDSVGPKLRLVFVDPSRALLDTLGLAESGGPRIAPKVVGPESDDGDCGLAEAHQAGAASMLRQAYSKTKSSSGMVPQVDWRFCYDDGLAWTGDENLSIVVPGAPEAFTDAYFDDAGNAELTTGLLSPHPRVLWLDKHAKTKEPPPSDGPPPTEYDEPPPTQDSRADRIEYPDEANTNPLYEVMPAWMWAMLLGILTLGVGLALWKGRRLGPPVTEPLLVTVPAAETVYGRARLYRRARAYNEALRALRAGALHRIQPILGLSSQAGQAEVVEAVASRTGWPSEYITATLYSTQPSNEAELYDATQAIDALVSAVETANPQGSN